VVLGDAEATSPTFAGTPTLPVVILHRHVDDLAAISPKSTHKAGLPW